MDQQDKDSQRNIDDRNGTAGDGSAQPAAAAPRRRFWKRAGIVTLGVGLIAGIGACSAGAYHHRHWGGWHRGEVTAEHMREHVDRGIERALEDTDATPEQKARIREIAIGAIDEMRTLRTRQRELRRSALDLMASPDLDRTAIEGLRARQMQLADEASRRIAQALGDVAEVLTPAQRATVTERLRARLSRRWS
ncbi:MAG: Spy/CpxP family protein refolding chaperone [Burkholderiales bacterium]|nr:MAG: Spy/CpxP family protein refolding chaperone [Burkholderiales bacterium]